jgi:hypothetical protein
MRLTDTRSVGQFPDSPADASALGQVAIPLWEDNGFPHEDFDPAPSRQTGVENLVVVLCSTYGFSQSQEDESRRHRA